MNIFQNLLPSDFVNTGIKSQHALYSNGKLDLVLNTGDKLLTFDLNKRFQNGTSGLTSVLTVG
jgi:hypothetical protein